MRLINLSDSKGHIRVDFAGCNMKCPYCVHIKQPWVEWNIEDVVEFVLGSSTQDVYMGGAEPTLQKELLPLVEQLHAAGKGIIVKSNGMKPEVLKQLLPFVKGFVLEIKAPLGDIPAIMQLTGMSEERTVKYVSLLHESLDIARTKWLRIWVRVLPEFVNLETMPKILPDMKGASEVMLYQFMSNPDFDLPFLGHDTPTPKWSNMELLGKLVLEDVPIVRLVGEMGNKVMKK
jgi:pyruvate formate lyase activating enzyme